MKPLGALKTKSKGRDTMSHELDLPIPLGSACPRKQGNKDTSKTVIQAALRRTIATSLALLGLAIMAVPARATSLVQNGEFSAYTVPTNPPLPSLPPGVTSFSFGNSSGDGNVAGWSVGQSSSFPASITPVDNGRVYFFFPGTATTSGAFYPHGATATIVLSGGDPSPSGGNFVGIDSGFGYTLSQTIPATLLSANTTYSLSFETAAAQQTIASGGLGGQTTDYWEVALGSDLDTTPLIISPYLPSEGFSGWIQEDLTFTTPSSIPSGGELLSFMAVGMPSGVPPFALLDSVDLEAVPEPASLLLLGSGLAALAGFRRLRRRNAP
jgi:hypothetical protein